MTPDAAASNDVFLGRQPILDKEQTLIGYELLFRSAAEYPVSSADSAPVASADVVCKAFSDLGLSRIFGNVRAFIQVQADFLYNDLIELLPKDVVVLEVDVTSFSDPALLPRCQALKNKGYYFSLSGLTEVTDRIWPLVGIAHWLKIDIEGLTGDQLQEVSRTLATARRTLIAANVGTPTQMELCAVLGFQLFQGYYFAQPMVIQGKQLDASTQGLMRLLKLIADDADIARVEEGFRTEPGLVVNLLRLTNSVSAGMRTKITSVRHAITAIGQRQLQRWLQMLLFSRGRSAELSHNPLMQLAALRGRFLELLAERMFQKKSGLCDPAFITGLLSVVPAALGMSMEEVLDQLALDTRVRAALASKEGELGLLLAIVEAYDDNDVEQVQHLLSGQGDSVQVGTLAEILADSLLWVQQLNTPQC